MKKAALLFLLTLSLCCFAAENKPVFKIGVIAPLTGDNAAVGESIKEGTLLAQKELEGRSAIPIKILFEDDQLVNQETNVAALRLIQLDQVDMIVTLWTPAANLVGPVSERHKVIQFNTGFDTSVTQKFRWTLVHGGDLREYAKQIVECMKLGCAHRLAIVSMQHLGNKKVVNAALPLIDAAGIKVVFNEPFVPGEKDFRTYALKIRQSHPDYILNLTLAPEDGMFFKAAREVGLDVPSTGFYYYTNPELYSYLEGAVFPDLATLPPFNKKFSDAYGHNPKEVEAGHCYDIIRMTSKAVDELYHQLGRMPTREELLTELRRPRPMKLAVGEGTMNPAGYVESRYIIKQIKNGKVVDYVPAK